MLRYILLLAVTVIAIQARSPRNSHCPIVICAMKRMYCENGFKIGADGCQTCECNQPPHCQPVKCKLFCIRGFKVGTDGCEICKCN